MWGANDVSFGGGGGGFLTSQGYESPQGGEKSKARRNQNFMPATCRQLLECTEDTFKVEGFEAHTLTVVGLVRAVETTTTKVSMFIEDQTGTIACVNYVGTDGEAASSEPTLLTEGTYGRVVGALRTTKNQKYVIIFKTAPVTDMNEVTCHILEVIQNRMKLKKLKEGDAQKAATSFGNGENTFSNSMLAGGVPTGTGGGGANVGGGVGTIAGFTANQNMVHRIICNAREESGIHKDMIIAAVKNKISQKELMEILDFLSNEGHVFSTVDDDHFKSTDSQYM